MVFSERSPSFRASEARPGFQGACPWSWIPARIKEPRYPSDQAVRRVRSNGEIKWAGKFFDALIGKPVGVADVVREGRALAG